MTWFDGGALHNLSYDLQYAAEQGVDPVINPGGVRLQAESALHTLDEMIASVRRGIWVNRLSNVVVMNRRTLLLTGTTRDGTFLIENGEITKRSRSGQEFVAVDLVPVDQPLKRLPVQAQQLIELERLLDVVERAFLPRYTVSIEFGSAPARVDELVAEVFTQVEALRRDGAGEAELAKVKEPPRPRDGA